MLINSSGVSVVIVNFNSARFISDCLKGLADDVVREIIILDNGSPVDESLALYSLSELDSRVKIVFSKINLGFGAGVNLAVKNLSLSETAIWVLNPDTKPNPGAATIWFDFLSRSGAAIASPLVTTGRESDRKIWYAGGELDLKKGETVHLGFGSKIFEQEGPFITEFISGAAPMFTRKAWEKLEGFSERYFLYWEDADLSLRASSQGVDLFVVPRACVWHEEGGSSKKSVGLSSIYYYYMQRNRFILFGTQRKFFTTITLPQMIPTLKLALKPIFREKSDRLNKLRSSLAGIIDGSRGLSGPK